MSEALQGVIAQGAFPGLLRRLHVERLTGMLHFERAGERGSVCVIEGKIAWGQSSIPECRLGPVLVRHGLVSQESLDQVYDLVGGKRLGDLLVELGSLDRDTLDEALALQVRETLLAAFSWHEGAWHFEPDTPDHFKGYDQSLRISTGDLILDAVWCVADPDVVRYAVGDLDVPLALTTDPLLRFQRLTLSSSDTLLLSLVDGRRSGREVLGLMPDAAEAQRSLLGLLCTGIVERLAEAPGKPAQGEQPVTREELLETHRGLATRDHFEVLGLLHSCGTAEVTEAWGRQCNRYRPARADETLRDLRPQLEDVLARFTDAAAVLSDPSRRDAYESALVVAGLGSGLAAAAEQDRPLDLSRVDEVLDLAQAELSKGRYWDALQVIESLPPDLPGRQQRRAMMARARAYAGNPNWLRQAEELLLAVLRDEPANAEACFVLGEVYRAIGLPARAEASFRRTLELKPRHAGARAALK
ncbi:MAG: DUF4388 domain-containing protein [Vicinamibacteria bacterium]